MKKYPLIKFTLLFICGIIIQKYFEGNISYFIPAFLLITFVLLILLKSKDLLYKSLFVSVLTSCLIILAGQFAAWNYEFGKNFLPEKFYESNTITSYGKIISINLKKEKYFDFIIQTDSVCTNKISGKTNVDLLCRLYEPDKHKSDSLYNELGIGNTLKLTGALKAGRDRRNPGEFDYDFYLRQQGISGIINVYQSDSIKILDKEKNLSDFIFQAKKYCDKVIYKLHQPKTAALLRGLLLADRSMIDEETRNAFTNSGVVHVLAVSGSHVAFIVLICLIFFGRFNIYMKSFLTIIGIIFFTLLTGMQPSMVRASIMVIVVILVMMSNRSTNLFNSLALSALIILIFNPGDLFDPGFQLSYASVLSIALIYPVFNKKINSLKLKGIVKYSLLLTGFSLSAQIGTMPLVIYYFGKISITALLANLLVIPATGVIMGIGVFTLLISPIASFIAAYYAAANDLLTKILYWFINLAGNPDYSFLNVRYFTVQDAIIFYVLVILFFILEKKFKSITAKIILAILIVANTLMFCSLDKKKYLSDNELNIMMIDVGQGDSFLIKFPNGKTALIDAGNVNAFLDNGERIIKPLLNYLDVDKIDYGLVSHVDSDHYAGFVSLIHFNKICRIIKPKLDTANDKDVRFEKFISKNNIPIEHVEKSILKIGNARIYILNDHENQFVRNSSNNNSTVLKIAYGNSSILFTGDLGKEAERYYVDRYGNFLKSNILKASHHGSKTGSSEGFINCVKPEISLISVGARNKFGHPSEEVISLLALSGSKIFRTDLNKAIQLRSDGNNFHPVNWNEL